MFNSKRVTLGIFWVAFCGWAMLSIAPSNARAGGPENVMLVVNADSPSSKLLANHYVDLRKIPSTNIVYLNGLPNKEITTLKVFKEQILEPVIAAIKTRGLEGHIDYIVYSSDFPTSVKVPEHLSALTKVFEEAGAKLQRKLYLPNASITTLTFFAAAVLKDDPGYMTLQSNSYYRRPASTLLSRPFIGKAQEAYQEAVDGITGDDDQALKKSEAILIALFKVNPRQLAVAYRLVQCYAKMGNNRKATEWLNRSVKLGWQYRDYTREDGLLTNIKDDPLWQGIVNRIPDEPFDFVPTLGFKNRYQYGPNSMLNALPGQGNRFFLSTTLGVTRNYGITEKQALDQLRRTVAADGTDPYGTFFFTETSDVRTRTRKPNFASAVKRLKAMGYDARVVKAKLPKDSRRVLGVTVGSAGFSWPASGSRFVPGAIADNLTSYGGRMHAQGQTKLTEFLAYGAAGASGTVTEPYALQAKFPHPMIHVHYAKGCTLAEAFYQSVHGPMQLLIVGDALCRPFGKVPGYGVAGIVPSTEVSGKIELQISPDADSIPIAGYQLFVDGQLVHVQPAAGPMAIDTTSMADGHHEVRIVAIANNLLESSASVVIPLQVNNNDHQVTLATAAKRFLNTDDIELTATSNLGDAIALVHNGRTIDQKMGREVTFNFNASLIGRGPVQLEAIAVSVDAVGEAQAEFQPVASKPLSFEIEGPISERKKFENPPKPKKPVVTKPK
jgi:hypothetical protein